jgi:hypothetical protein
MVDDLAGAWDGAAGRRRRRRRQGKDLARARDGAVGRGVAGGGEEMNLGFRVLGVLGLRVWWLARVRSPELGEV